MGRFPAVGFFAFLLFSCGDTPPNGDNPQIGPSEKNESKREARKGFATREFASGRIFKKYLVFYPEGFGAPNRTFPVVLHLHNARFRGSDAEKLKETGLLKAAGENGQFVVVSPLCPEGRHWAEDPENIIGVLDEVLKDEAIDAKRAYLLGHSIGANGTWITGARFPEKFAAMVALANGADLSGKEAESLREMPIWAFHGANDDVVSLETHQKTADAVKAIGNSKVKFTILPEGDHSLRGIYEDGEIFRWMLEHRRE